MWNLVDVNVQLVMVLLLHNTNKFEFTQEYSFSKQQILAKISLICLIISRGNWFNHLLYRYKFDDLVIYELIITHLYKLSLNKAYHIYMQIAHALF